MNCSHHLPTDRSHTSASPESVGLEDGGTFQGKGVAVLDSPIEVSLPCYYCGKESTFVAEIRLLHGWFGTCLGCGDERFVPYTRSVEE